MIVDANVLLRTLDGARTPHGEAARARVRRARAAEQPLTVLSPTVLEVAYVLESPSAGYGWKRPEIAEALEAILDEPAFAVEHRDNLHEAITTYQSSRIDLHDCLLAAIAQTRRTCVLSFDQDLRRLGVGEAP